MENLIEFGYQLFDTFGFLVEFLATPFTIPSISSWGLVPVITLITVTPGQLLVGSGLIIVLTIKVYKFVLDLIPFA